MAEKAILLRVELPEEIATKYEAQAKASSLTLEQIAAYRLIRSVDHNDQKPFYLNDAQRQQLEQIVGKNLRTVDELIGIVRRALSLRINSQLVTLSVNLRERLESRNFSKRPFGEWLASMIVEWAEQYVGLR